MGALSEAQTLLEKAAMLSDDPAESSLDELANLRFMQGRFQESEELYSRLLSRAQKRKGSQHTSVAYILRNQGELQLTCAETARARESIERSLQILRTQYGPDHYEVALTIMALAAVCRDEGDVDQAEAMARDAVERLKAAFGSESYRVAEAMVLHADMLRAKGQLEPAQAQCAAAIKRLEEVFSRDSVALIDAGTVGARIARDQNDLKTAETMLRSAAAISERIFGATNFHTGKVLHELALVMHQQKDSKAKDVNDRSLQVLTQSFPATHPTIIAARQMHNAFAAESSSGTSEQ